MVNTKDVSGGAARSAHRLYRGLREAGVDATMLVAERVGADENIAEPGRGIVGRALGFADEIAAALALLPYRSRRPGGYEAFRVDRPLIGRVLEPALSSFDLVNLHWIAGFLDFASLPRLAARAPVVWTLHDMLPMTGGCHYDDGCGRYLQRCGACPQLGSATNRDLSAAIFGRRQEYFGRIAPDRLHFVSPSRWLAEQARRSPICGRFGVSVIPYGLDLQIFAPSDRVRARAALDLPQDRVVVLFVSEEVRNRRKGMHLLVEALSGLLDLSARLQLVSVGRDEGAPLPGFARRHLSQISDDRKLAELYSAADVLVIPSLQDNLPNTMIEAMACGTAVAGFATGGIPDMVRDGETGWLVPPSSVEGLRAVLRRIVARPEDARAMGRRAREVAASGYSLAAQAEAYGALFKHMLR